MAKLRRTHFASLAFQVAVFVAVSVLVGRPQVTDQQSPSLQSPGHQPNGNSPFSPQSEEGNPYFSETARQKRNEERQKRLESDADRLLSLANQLKSEVAATGAESMTPDMLHQMDEIEKLAKSVKDRMRE